MDLRNCCAVVESNQGVLDRFKIKVAVGVGGFPVDRHGDRAIVLSSCFCVKKGNGTF